VKLLARPWLAGVSYVDEDRSRHTLDGHPVLGVTTALRMAGLSADFKHVEPLVLAARATLGQAVHAAAHYEDEGDIRAETIHPSVVPYLDGWRLLRQQRKFRPELLETIVASRKHRFIGRLDRIGIADVGRVLLDLKIGNPDDARADLQTAGYEVAVYEEIVADLSADRPSALLYACPRMDIEPVERWSVQLRNNGTYRLRRYPLAGRSRRHDRADLIDAVRDANMLAGYYAAPGGVSQHDAIIAARH
jgi:hypothetical protein